MTKRIIFSFLTLAVLMHGCKNSNKQQSSATEIEEKPFGNYEGKAVSEYTIKNSNGIEVSLINYGGTLTKIMVPDRDGKKGDIILGFDNIEGYLQNNNPYFGSLVGRFGNRIANAKFELNGKTYNLSANDNGNSLHGGEKGFDKVYWQVEKMAGDSSLKLSYLSKDGEEGYPGNLSVTVIYSLSGNDELKIDYSATTDRATPVNLTSHAYFNLSAGLDSTILNHSLQISADRYTPVNDLLIPTGKIDSVEGTAMDFLVAKEIGRDISKITGGYDHNWVLRKNGSQLEKIASLYHAGSGRVMDVITAEPGLQFYSGNFLDGSLKHTKNRKRYGKYAALCLETQHYPDSPNQPDFPTTILQPGQTYSHTTIYKFSIKQ